MKILFLCITIFTIPYILAQQSKLSKAVNAISEYIASEKFIEIRNSSGDLNSVDSLYHKALEINDYNYGETLLSLMFATVPYREVPIRLPVLDIITYYPLISADEETFLRKNENLPRFLFIDTPQNDYGDLDKLAHFFGSAFLSYESRIFDLGGLIGYFVEAFEETFKVQASIDERDLMTNNLGNIFGKMLKQNKNILPSQIIILKTLSYFKYTL